MDVNFALRRPYTGIGLYRRWRSAECELPIVRKGGVDCADDVGDLLDQFRNCAFCDAYDRRRSEPANEAADVHKGVVVIVVGVGAKVRNQVGRTQSARVWRLAVGNGDLTMAGNRVKG